MTAALVALTAESAGPPPAQPLDRAAQVMGVKDLQSIRYSGTAIAYRLGQSRTPNGPWPEDPGNPIEYTIAINYKTPSRRLEKIRVRGGKEHKVVQAVVDRLAWDEIGAVMRPVSYAAAERLQQIWMTPHGFIKAALTSKADSVVETSNVASRTKVSFVLGDKFQFRGWIDSENLLTKVETWIGDSEGYFGVLGDLLVETIYSDYQEFQNIRFPTRIVQNWDGFPVLEITVKDVESNPGGDVLVPSPIRDGTAEPFPVTARITELAEGVWYLTGAIWHSVAVEFSDHLVVIEAPFSQDRSIAVIDELQHQFSDKRIRYVINTHHHFDHSGGLRTYAAYGATIVTHEANREFFKRVFSAPRTLAPDQLARSGVQPRLQTLTDELTLADDTRTVQLFHLPDSHHSTGMLVAYLPAERLLIEADVLNPPPTAIAAPLDPEAINLLRFIERHSLKVEQIVPLHGQPIFMKDLLSAAGTTN